EPSTGERGLANGAPVVAALLRGRRARWTRLASAPRARRLEGFVYRCRAISLGMKHWITWIGPLIAVALVVLTREMGWVVGALATACALATARYLDVRYPLGR